MNIGLLCLVIGLLCVVMSLFDIREGERRIDVNLPRYPDHQPQEIKSPAAVAEILTDHPELADRITITIK